MKFFGSEMTPPPLFGHFSKIYDDLWGTNLVNAITLSHLWSKAQQTPAQRLHASQMALLYSKIAFVNDNFYS